MNTEELQKGLDAIKGKETASLTKSWDRHRFIRREMGRVEKLFRKKAIGELFADIPADNQFHPISVEQFKIILKAKQMDIYKNPFRTLWCLLSDLEEMYGIEISVSRSQSGIFTFKKVLHRPKYLAYKVKGQALNSVNSKKKQLEFQKRSVGLGCLLNEIEIEDITSTTDLRKGSRSQLLDILRELDNKISPTVIKYSCHDTFKRCLIYLPAGLDITTFSKVYLARCSKIRNSFYQKKYLGRPKTKFHQERRIRQILKDIYGNNPLSQIPSTKLHSEVAAVMGMKSETIRRSYGYVFRELKTGEK